jgi:hypothetical protein
LTTHVPASRVTPCQSLLPAGSPAGGSGSVRRSIKKVSTTIYIEPEQLDQLKLLNERTKVPMAEYIREGIDLVLQKHQDKLPGRSPSTPPAPAAAPPPSSSSGNNG